MQMSLALAASLPWPDQAGTISFLRVGLGKCCMLNDCSLAACLRFEIRGWDWCLIHRIMRSRRTGRAILVNRSVNRLIYRDSRMCIVSLCQHQSDRRQRLIVRRSTLSVADNDYFSAVDVFRVTMWFMRYLFIIHHMRRYLLDSNSCL